MTRFVRRERVQIKQWVIITIIPRRRVGYINNSLHLARKYAQIFVRHYLSPRNNSSVPKTKLVENCELRGADNVLGQISEHIFKVKWRLLCLLSFKYFLQHAGIGRIRHSVICQSRQSLSGGFQNLHVSTSVVALVESVCLGKR